MSEIVLSWAIGSILWIIIGAAVLAAIDTKEEVFRKWVGEDPTQGLISSLILLLWPILAYFMIRYRMQQ